MTINDLCETTLAAASQTKTGTTFFIFVKHTKNPCEDKWKEKIFEQFDNSTVSRGTKVRAKKALCTHEKDYL